MTTTADPGTAPNTGMYFSPGFSCSLNFANNLNTAKTASIALTYETEYIVEFRGAKQ